VYPNRVAISCEGTPLDEVGAQRLVSSMEDDIGFQKVAEAEGVVHDPNSEMGVGFALGTRR
jgi:hypothetical protein